MYIQPCEVMAALGCSNGGLSSAHCPRQPGGASAQRLENALAEESKLFFGLEELPHVLPAICVPMLP